jgi:hypothetical protein
MVNVIDACFSIFDLNIGDGDLFGYAAENGWICDGHFGGDFLSLHDAAGAWMELCTCDFLRWQRRRRHSGYRHYIYIYIPQLMTCCNLCKIMMSKSNSTGAQSVTLQIKLDEDRSVWLSKMVLAQHFCTLCWGCW